MFNFIYQGALIGFLRIHCFSTVIEDRWKLIASITLGISLAIPTILYTAVCSHYGIDVNYGNNTYNILDIIIDSKTKPIGSLTLGAIKIILIIFYSTIITVRFFGQRREAYTAREDTAERKTSIKIIFYYQILMLVIGLSFFIKNGFNVYHDSKAPKGINAITVLEGMQVLNMLLCDLFGLVVTLVFCVSPGKMEEEFNRLMFLPRLAKGQFQKMQPITEKIDIEDMALLDIDRCRRFVLYHKPTF